MIDTPEAGSSSARGATHGGRTRRVVFFAEAVTLAHVARPYTLARSLPRDVYEVVFASHPRFNNMFGPASWRCVGLESISTTRFLHALEAGRPVYDTATLDRYVEEDCRLIDELRPDVVVGDFRISLSVSARKRRVPYVNVTNAYWSPYAHPEWVAPAMPITEVLGPRLASSLFRAARPLAFAVHAMPMNAVRKRHGLPRAPRDVRHIYADGDITLYADLAGLIPLVAPPASHRPLGPIEWSPAQGMPSWWDNLAVDPRRSLVYVNLGSSGRIDLLPRILEAVADNQWTTVIATAGASLDTAEAPNVYCEPYFNGAEVAKSASLVICNGGSPTTQQALLHGAPVLGLPSNLDQFLNMGFIQRAGLGILCRADGASVSAIRSAARRVMENPLYLENATRIARQNNTAQSLARFKATIDSLC